MKRTVCGIPTYIALILGLILFLHPAYGEDAGTPVVEAIVISNSVRKGDPNADEGETRNVSHFPENPELFVPMPIPVPESKTSPAIPRGEGQVISYNILTGEETITERASISNKESARTSGNPGIGWDTPAEEGSERAARLNFSNLLMVANPEDYPWRVNCKLFMTFGTEYYVGSGVLIDPMHVLTAGHCVNNGGGGAWADTIVVVPGYQNLYCPYGVASSVYMHSWTGWTQLGDWNYDMAVIDLDRPIGAIVGWHAYGTNSSCSFFTGNNFHNPGYPAESPHNGLFMYYFHGSFDHCLEYQLGFNNRAYGGQSGSGAYHIGESETRCVYAVVSHKDSVEDPIPTWDTRIVPAKFADIGSWINEDTPSTFDLIPLYVQTSPSTIMAGGRLASMSYVVHNYSNATVWTGNVNVGVYLSTDDNISSSDVLIQSHTFCDSISAKGSILVSVSDLPYIPPSTPDGDYYIGVILTISDYNTGNNDSDGQDASAIRVDDERLALLVSQGAGDLNIYFWNTLVRGDRTYWDCYSRNPSPMIRDLWQIPTGNDGVGLTALDFTGLSREELAVLVSQNAGDLNIYFWNAPVPGDWSYWDCFSRNPSPLARDLWKIPIGNNAVDVASVNMDNAGKEELAMLVSQGAGDLNIYFWNAPAAGDWSYWDCYRRNPSPLARDLWQIPTGNTAVGMTSIDFAGLSRDEIAVLVSQNMGDLNIYFWNAPVAGDWTYWDCYSRNPSPLARDLWQIPIGNDAVGITAVDHDGDGKKELAVLVSQGGGDLNIYFWNAPVAGDWTYWDCYARNPSPLARDLWQIPIGNNAVGLTDLVME